MRSKKAIKNIISSLVLQFVILVSGFIVPKLIIKTFGSNVNGLISSITQFLAYISLLESGMGPVVRAALYKPIANKDQKSITNILKASEKFFRIISLIFIGYLLILIFVYPFIINDNFSYLYTISLILIISITTFFEYYFGITYKLYLHAKQKNYVTSYIQILTYLLNVIIVIILVKLNCGIHIIKLVSGFIFILRPIIQNIYVKRKYKINLKEADDNYKLEQKWDGLIQHIAAIIHTNTDVVVLTIFRNLVEVSIYSVYHLVVKGIKSIISAFTSGVDASFGDMIAKNETENLNKKFNIYEVFYLIISTIFYLCTIILILPFVKVYTLDIVDVNYVMPLFAYLLVLSEFVTVIRSPYSSLILSAGHFKQTKKGAIVEAITNIVLSIVLVIKFGIIGVAIGTLVSVIIRTTEFIYYANKYILKRNVLYSIKKIFIIIIEFLIAILITKFIPLSNIDSYGNWFIYALLIFGIISLLVIIINVIFYKKELSLILSLFKKVVKKNESKKNSNEKNR